MLTIWGRDNSTNVKKVLWCADELQLSYSHIPIGGAYGKNHDAAYLAMNPNGLVPCIQDGDLVLWESNTIVRYLAAQYGEGSLWQADNAARAAAEKWMDWNSTALAGVFRMVFLNMVRTAPGQRDMQAVAQGMGECEKLFAIADRALAQQPFLSGEQFGIGDMPLGCFAYAWYNMAIERQKHPNLERWYQQLCARPAFQRRVAIALS